MLQANFRHLLALLLALGIASNFWLLSLTGKGCESTGNDLPTTGKHQRSSDFVGFNGTLTIVIDQAGSCPKGCAFIHHLLPDTLPYRYAECCSNLTNQDQHILLVARSPLNKPEYKKLCDYQRQRGYSVGLFLMGDEFYLKEARNYYSNFDYVLRHYFDSTDVSTRALGNMTCGVSPPLPMPNSPKWGVHWVFLSVGPIPGLADLASKASAVWPSAQRPINCSFIGRSTSPRSEMKEAFQKYGSDLSCDIEFTRGFKQGVDPWDLVVHRMTLSKIGMNPTGNNPECHRLPELLQSGVVPAMIENDKTRFVDAAFRRLPAILGGTWQAVIDQTRRLLDPVNVQELSALQEDAAHFYSELQECMKMDLAFIFSHAFGEAHP